eukprot:757941-Amphidinium_carterae.1
MWSGRAHLDFYFVTSGCALRQLDLAAGSGITIQRHSATRHNFRGKAVLDSRCCITQSSGLRPRVPLLPACCRMDAA